MFGNLHLVGLTDGHRPNQMPFDPFPMTNTTGLQDGNTDVGQSFHLYLLQDAFPANSHKERASAGGGVRHHSHDDVDPGAPYDCPWVG